MSKIIVTFPSC